jgi:ATP-dependent exoDNAse (exonuclease V) beta subunit
MLDNLRRSPLFREIGQSSQRYSEVPFTMKTSMGTLHGMIDLLYRDQQGLWQLVDWKTEWVQAGRVGEQIEHHRLQMAIYALAAQQRLGVVPRSLLCFLGAGATIHEFEPDELSAAWQQVIQAAEQSAT